MDDRRIAYDDQATVFEDRAGIPDPAAAMAAEGVRRHLPGTGALLLEIGAGTGVIGRWLAHPGVRYLGLDSSQGMLDVFRPRLGPGGVLVRADADRPWPLSAGSVSVIFGSRVLHLLQPEHAVRQARRVTHPDGAVLLSGRIEHDRASPRALARARLRDLLTEHGLRPRPTGGRPGRLLALAEQSGGRPLPVRVAASWPETVTLRQVIEWWRGKTSIGGVNPPPELADRILAALTDWARARQPDRPVTTETRYLLEGVRLPTAAPGAGVPDRGAPTIQE